MLLWKHSPEWFYHKLFGFEWFEKLIEYEMIQIRISNILLKHIEQKWKFRQMVIRCCLIKSCATLFKYFNIVSNVYGEPQRLNRSDKSYRLFVENANKIHNEKVLKVLHLSWNNFHACFVCLFLFSKDFQHI